MDNTLINRVKKFSLPAGFLKRKKLLFGAITIVVVALGGYFFLGSSKKAAAGYVTESVQNGSISTTISANGTVKPVSTVSLAFKNAEIIKNIYVKVGDHVTTGQALAEQNSENLELSLTQAAASVEQASASLELLQNGSTQEELRQSEANVNMAQASYDQAKSNLERYQKLAEMGAVSQTDLESAQISYANAEGKLIQAQASYDTLLSGNKAQDIRSAGAKLSSSQAQLKSAQIDLSGSKMVSPIAGIVSEINGAVGQRATANNNSTSGSSGFMVVISEALQVTAQVNEADIGKTEVGQKVEFTVNSFAGKTFTGQVSSIAPQAYTQSNVQLYDVIITIDDNQQGLKAGMPADVTIIVEKKDNVLTVSKAAVTYAASYLSKQSQSGAAKAATTGSGSNSQSKNSKQTSTGSGTSAVTTSASTGGTAGTATSSQGSQATVLVMGRSGQPEPRQVALGMSDLSNYEVVSGLNEGETVVTGARTQASTSSSTSSSSSKSSTKSNQGGGGMMGGPPGP